MLFSPLVNTCFSPRPFSHRFPSCLPLCFVLCTLEQHGVRNLFKLLGSMVFHDRPTDVPKFLGDELKKMISVRKGRKHHPYYSETDLKTVFHQMDVLEHGSISLEQYQIAMYNIGCDDIEAYMPHGETVDLKAFTSLATKALFDKIPGS